MDQVERRLRHPGPQQGVHRHQRRIWDRPEVAFCEKYASETLALYLRARDSGSERARGAGHGVYRHLRRRRTR